MEESIKEAIKRGVPEQEAQNIFDKLNNKVETGEWVELFHEEPRHGITPYHPQSTSTIRYWGPKSYQDQIKTSSAADKFYDKGEIGKTHELKIGSDKYLKSSLLFIPYEKYIPIEHSLRPEAIPKVKEAYKIFSDKIITDTEADEILDRYPRRLEMPIVLYCGREEIKKWYNEFRKKTLSDTEAEKLLFKYLGLKFDRPISSKDVENIQSNYRPSEAQFGRAVHRHWEIKEIYDKQQKRKQKGLESLLVTVLIIVGVFAAIPPSITGLVFAEGSGTEVFAVLITLTILILIIIARKRITKFL